MLVSSFNLSQSFNYTPYLFYKNQFKSEINSFYKWTLVGLRWSRVSFSSYSVTWTRPPGSTTNSSRGMYKHNKAGHRHGGWWRRHPVSQSGTGAFQYRTGSPYSGTGLVPASAFLFIPVPNWLDAGQSDIQTFKKGVHPARPYCWRRKGIHPARLFCWR